jgi:arabinogalactan oligomer/maltooligosaccharide transport system substrate-binding protein
MEVGLNPDGITNYCTWNNKKGDIKGTDVAQSLLNLANSAGYISGGDDALVTGAENGTVIAGVSGVWLAERLKSAWGKNYGATKLPCYTVAGKQVQMGSYTGYKLVGVNEYSANKEWATKLAEYMISKECQELRYEMRGQGPANAEAAASDAVKSNVALTALIKQSDFGSLQRIGAAYWGPAGEFGNLMASGQKGNSSLQEIMDTLVAGITSVE